MSPFTNDSLLKTWRSLDGVAAKKYVEAAKLYQSQGDQSNLFDAATAYEEAYKAYNMDKKNESMS